MQYIAYTVILLLSSVALQCRFKGCQRVVLRSKVEEKPDLLARGMSYITKVNSGLSKQTLLSSLVKNRLCQSDTIKSQHSLGFFILFLGFKAVLTLG